MSIPRQLGTPARTFVVERYWPGVTVKSFTDAVRRFDESVAGMRQEGVPIEAVTATLVPIDEAAYWVVDAPSADAIALACERAGLTVERIVDALELRTGPEPPGSAHQG